ncbi:DNA sulfur modification protein DndD [Clostridium perfringens]|uniref:DNA sulfur modification protein DndD n=1 Tax=Clostridium perfringens TaxID=1502 RepID=UPI002245B7D8|nr:DNA sulfur modification protein DndD [Clostridium perfringens]MCX0416853.1 DNA sulfur modification protein DndD [Clostridium perfringens]MDM0459590.1 DNA sulfur modification protein DndD [Clostridium perfringens]
MIINNITLKNFRSYEDETTFSFTPNGNKNIVLIGGENGAGKSTLFEAIKLCIYGPTTYGYLGNNYNYQTKIKNNINDNAFKNEDIESFIGLSLSFKEGTELKSYYLKRIWKYKNHKLNEEFKVFLNDKELSEDDKIYFDKYLKSVLPPSLFDFFFFDGEELSDFFVGKSSSSNLKEAVLELFNYDTFDVLKKQLLSYQRTHSKENKNLDEAQTRYDELSSEIHEIKNNISELENIILNNKSILEDLYIRKQNAEDDFRNSGGIFEEERLLLNSQINKLESERTEINQEIKDFCNDTLPFLIVSKLLKNTKKQIDEEEALISFNSISKKLSGNIIESTLNKHLPKHNNVNYDEIALTLLNEMFEVDKMNDISNILELSNEDKNSINFIINNILGKSNDFKFDILSKFTRLKEISLSIKILREKLNSTVSGDFLNNYLETTAILNKQISETENIIASSKAKLEEKYNQLSLKEYHLTRAKNEFTSLLQNNNVLEMSSSIISYLDKLLKNITRDKIDAIEEEFINIFKNIIRKDNYVNSIVIDDSFNSTLYINKEYDTNEILNILTNLGFEGTEKKYGSKFIDDLFNYFDVANYKSLTKKLEQIALVQYISLSSKVNINDFSKGEKQIYILCLIWAIIKSSGVEIPFIIDTPYARIDETHRNALTTTYLPNISKQVIILSTNKEIDSDLYQVVKPYVCNEYLLLYNTNLRKTEVKNGYFEV